METSISSRLERDATRLVAIVAHELRNPLLPILSGAVLLQRRAADPEVVTTTARIIERQARLLGRLIDDLLSVSRSQRGVLHLHRQRISMTAIIESCVHTMIPYVNDSGQGLRISISDDAMELHADVERLSQVLQNLIVNAVKFGHRGGSIDVRAERDQGDALVTVTDGGIGIGAPELEAIFELYGQCESARSREAGSLGVGLFVARRFAEAHGGTLTAASPGLGHGSTFTLRLPCIGFAPQASGHPQWGPGSRSVSLLTTA
jgi:signal transduction histidine kinase